MPLNPSNPHAHAWMRVGARNVDMLVFMAFLALVLFVPAIAFELVTQVDSIFAWIDDVGETVATMVVVAFWIPLEALLLSTWGFTPGKWLFNIRIAHAEHASKLRFSQALKRSVLALVVGFALGFWILAPLCALRQYNFLVARRTTTYDQKLSLRVQYGPLGFGRMFGIGLMLLCLISISIVERWVLE